MNARQLLDTLYAGRVQRCHTIPHHGSYNVAQHSWGVAMLVLAVFPDRAFRLLPAALAHDVPEAWVGDIPSPTIRSLGIREALDAVEGRLLQALDLRHHFAHLSDEDVAALLFCDRLEFVLWCAHESMIGNRYAACCMNRALNYIAADLTKTPAPAADYLRELLTGGPLDTLMGAKLSINYVEVNSDAN
jgi:5'-deoxynucleotidase YfbR-like HD superfamily hydrolase